jgi:hypothetical protein
LFILYLNEFKESKYLNDVQIFLLNDSFIWIVKNFNKKYYLQKLIQRNFSSSHPSLKNFKSLQNPSLIEFKSQHPVISLVSIVVKVFLYQEWHFTPEAIVVSISLSFFSVYSIYPSAPPHVSRSHLHMKHSRCTINSPFNQPIIFCSVINHSFPPHSR